MSNDEFEDLDFEQEQPQEAFHIEADLYDNGEFSNMLVIPCNDSYIVVGNNEHICTLVHTCNEVECWEQQEGGLDEEIVEKIGAAIQGYIDSL
jgi:hypothetical protein